jgi:phage terminase large subunit-like protein
MLPKPPIPLTAPTLTASATSLGADLIASAPVWVQKAFLSSLSDAELQALPYLFAFWAMPHQVPPPGDWRSWVILGGRGAGKTRAGAEWVRRMVASGARRIAVVGETYHQAREVMVFGDSGIMAVCPPDARPKWIATRQMLVWPNGAQATLFSAQDPEALRGPQFDAAWVDELAKWRKAAATWDMLQFGLRLGDAPRVCVTTTPRRQALLRKLLDRPSTVVTHAPTSANRANLADSFLAEMAADYAGTALGRQELDGVMLDDVEGALWQMGALAACQLDTAPPLTRIVVAIDPPTTAHAGSDACGIIVAGVVMAGPVQDWRGYVLEDASLQGASPDQWARAAIAAMARHNADRLVAEVNQGGDMVAAVIRQIDPLVPLRTVHASRGKVARAEPVAALYEQGRVRHLRGLGDLEDQMCQMTQAGYQGRGSPDRVDALVWALHDLMIGPAQSWRNPQIRGL